MGARLARLRFLLAAALLSGCIDLAPTYHRPAAPTPAQFPAGPAYPLPPAEPRPLVGWQDFFSDPKLKLVIEQALANNRDLRVAVADIAAARAQYRVQRSELFPTITGSASATWAHEPLSTLGGGFLGNSTGGFSEHLYSVTGGFSAYQVDLFGRVRNLTRAAQEQYFATREARDAVQISLVSEVAAAYLALGADRALLQIARDTLQNGTETLTVTRHLFENGVGAELAVSQAETIVDQARFDTARLTTQIAQDKNALDLLVGAPVAEDLLPPGIGQPIVVLERLPAALSSSVLLERPDVVQAEDQLRAANANIGAARAAFFPSITLTGAGGVESTALSSLFRGASEAWVFTPTVSQTIFDFGANLGNLALAKAQRDAGVANYEKAIQTAFREVADALAQRGTIDERLAAQRALTVAWANSLRLSTLRFREGSDTYLNVLIAQRSLFLARQTLVATQLAEATNLVTLYTTLGGGLNAPPAPPPAAK
ncbi:MAG: efflux transporter outer membrane subunit [Caulobacteraceae bacterium]|nr:efflux transporter outer membrane subunit [Caulobacteraceae bacterium]